MAKRKNPAKARNFGEEYVAPMRKIANFDMTAGILGSFGLGPSAKMMSKHHITEADEVYRENRVAKKQLELAHDHTQWDEFGERPGFGWHRMTQEPPFRWKSPREQVAESAERILERNRTAYPGVRKAFGKTLGVIGEIGPFVGPAMAISGNIKRQKQLDAVRDSVNKERTMLPSHLPTGKKGGKNGK